MDLRSLTPARCRLLLAVLLVTGFALHLIFLMWDCPIDLFGDEAHYWDWSRQLDVAYYSKPGMVAWLIRASCSVFGDVMWAVRLPAGVLAVGTSICTYWLMRHLFKSDRLALGTVVLTHTVPMYIVGSMAMATDSPLFFFWALTTCFAALAIFCEKKWAWLAMGLAGALGVLSKYAMPLWYVGLVLFLMCDRPSRKWLRTRWPYLGLLFTLLAFAAPLWWNYANGWVTAKHVGRQTGVTATEGAWYLNPPLMVATEAGIVGPILAVFIVLAAIKVIRLNREVNEPETGSTDFRAARFLLCIGGGYFLCCLLASFRVVMEANWPAPAFYTLVPLAAWWLSTKWNSPADWKPVRGFFWAHVTIGIVALLVIHQTHHFYPLALKLGLKPRQVDLAQIIKSRGNAEYGQAVSRVLREHPGAFVLTRKYQDASLLAFYVEGQPKTYNIGSYLIGRERTRHSQFDVWKDRDLANPELIGRDAVFFGKPDPDDVIRNAFDRFERVEDVKIIRGGLELHSQSLYVGYGFKGVRRSEPGSY
jgi:4-amino-4-deoxy-L-arabinose transferase-like glycosyltransferase